MSVPLFPEKIGRPGMLTAERMIAFRREHGLRGASPPDAVVICLYNGVRRRLSWRYRFSRVSGFLGDLYVVRRRPRRIGVMVGVGMGAPAIANAAEELIAFGTRRLVILSLAGAVRPGLAPGSLVVADRALRDEGTSYHYLPPARDVRASSGLVAALVPALAAADMPPSVGAVWSSDAPYRDTREEAQALAAEGVLATEMESAGLFAVAAARGAEAASVLVVADSLGGREWAPPPDMGALHRRIRAVLGALVETLARAAPDPRAPSL